MREGTTRGSMLQRLATARRCISHKYNTMKRWLLALVIVAAFISYPLLLLAGLLWAMARIVGMV
jgi:hypothetical protein